MGFAAVTTYTVVSLWPYTLQVCIAPNAKCQRVFVLALWLVFLNCVNRSNYYLKSHLNCILMHMVKYRDFLPWAVRKWLNQSRCSLECWVKWAQRTCITWGWRCRMGRSTFGVSGWLKNIVKHRSLWVWLYLVWPVFEQGVPFLAVTMIAPVLKLFVALILIPSCINLTALKIWYTRGFALIPV